MLEWEEYTFLGLKSFYQRLVTRPRERVAAAVRVSLEDHRQRLFLLAHMAAGRSVVLFETDEPFLCDSERIFLPTTFSKANHRAANLAFYEIKTLLGGLAIQQCWSGGSSLMGYVAEMNAAFPGLPRMIDQTAAAFPTSDEFWVALGKIRVSKNGLQLPSQDLSKIGEKPDGEETEVEVQITEIEGRGQLDVSSEFDRDDDGPGHEMPIHTFEKAETLEEHTGLSRRNDDEDELEDHEEALRDVNMSHVLRSRDRPNSIYRADVILDSLALETGDSEKKSGGIPYPEWDFRKRQYRENWCHVHENTVPATATDAGWAKRTLVEHGGLILSLKKSFAHLANEYLRAKRQPSGPEFDLDALVENRIAWRSGHAPDENIYTERKRELHDVAALILLDRSYSTDGFIDGSRVLDLIRETTLCSGEVLDEYLNEFAVAAFSSDTRHHCSFDWVKPFDEPWIKTHARLGELRSAGYTRIGPALRHSYEALEKRFASRKVVILITDGRPCDYDRYEGIYGIHDVKQAIAGGSNRGIRTHAFAIETRARETFPAMFTRDHFHVVPKPEALTKSLCALFQKLKSR